MFLANLIINSNKHIKLFNSKVLLNSFPFNITKSCYIKPALENVELDKSSLNAVNSSLSIKKIEKNDNYLNELLLSVRNRKHRDKNSEIIIEGRRLILDAISCGVQLKKLFFSQKDELLLCEKDLLKLSNFEIYKVPHHNLKLWSTLTTQPGLLGIFTRPNTPIQQFSNTDYVPITVICDNIREPNNLGSIIRISAALPCNKIILLKGCCDPWEPKALRSGCGGHFRINVETNLKWEDMAEYLPQNSSIYIADSNILKMKEKDVVVKSFSDVEIAKNNFLIIGGETHGVSDEAYKLLKCRKGIGIHIPLANNIDSLNTASALSIILFSLRQKIVK